ncbi:hypothetical protein [Micromonospora sp. NPDC005197]|uniref:hypothetical protein n=1 Tax=Micromonospora sp. NPDC005197 TaxID=3157020 RepID=UPI0033A2FD1F
MTDSLQVPAGTLLHLLAWEISPNPTNRDELVWAVVVDQQPVGGLGADAGAHVCWPRTGLRRRVVLRGAGVGRCDPREPGWSPVSAPSPEQLARWWRVLAEHEQRHGRCPICGTRARCWVWAGAFANLIAHDAYHLGAARTTARRG